MERTGGGHRTAAAAATAAAATGRNTRRSPLAADSRRIQPRLTEFAGAGPGAGLTGLGGAVHDVLDGQDISNIAPKRTAPSSPSPPPSPSSSSSPSSTSIESRHRSQRSARITGVDGVSLAFVSRGPSSSSLYISSSRSSQFGSFRATIAPGQAPSPKQGSRKRRVQQDWPTSHAAAYSSSSPPQADLSSTQRHGRKRSRGKTLLQQEVESSQVPTRQAGATDRETEFPEALETALIHHASSSSYGGSPDRHLDYKWQQRHSSFHHPAAAATTAASGPVSFLPPAHHHQAGAPAWPDPGVSVPPARVAPAQFDYTDAVASYTDSTADHSHLLANPATTGVFGAESLGGRHESARQPLLQATDSQARGQQHHLTGHPSQPHHPLHHHLRVDQSTYQPAAADNHTTSISPNPAERSASSFPVSPPQRNSYQPLGPYSAHAPYSDSHGLHPAGPISTSATPASPSKPLLSHTRSLPIQQLHVQTDLSFPPTYNADYIPSSAPSYFSAPPSGFPAAHQQQTTPLEFSPNSPPSAATVNGFVHYHNAGLSGIDYTFLSTADVFDTISPADPFGSGQLASGREFVVPDPHQGQYSHPSTQPSRYYLQRQTASASSTPDTMGQCLSIPAWPGHAGLRHQQPPFAGTEHADIDEKALLIAYHAEHHCADGRTTHGEQLATNSLVALSTTPMQTHAGSIGKQDQLPAVEEVGEVSDSDLGNACVGKKKKKGKKDNEEKKPRGHFAANDRKATAETRERGACVRCRAQRIRCVSGEEGDGGECRTCSLVKRESKKVIHRVPCSRDKLTDATLYREGGLGLTRRWEGTKMVDVGDWADESVKEIHMSIGFYDQDNGHLNVLCEDPIQLQVRKFVPTEGDVLVRKWVALENGERKTKEFRLEPYALANINATSVAFKDYIRKNVVRLMLNAVRNAHPLIRDTYEKALYHAKDLQDPKEKDLLEKLLELWFIIRHTMGSSWISGSEKLGMEPVLDRTYPLWNKVSVPRMIVAQFDSIHANLLKDLSGKFLKDLEARMLSRNSLSFFTIYLVVFILLHNVSQASKDRKRHAEQNGVQTKYSLPREVEKLQESANYILCHWHYYKGQVDPLAEDWMTSRKRFFPKSGGNPGGDTTLSPEQRAFLQKSYRVMNDPDQKSYVEAVWSDEGHDDEFYFVAQMYERGWNCQHPTYNTS